MSMRLNQYHLYMNDDFRGVVAAALMHAVVQVEQESADTPHHINRIALARTLRAELAQEDLGEYTRRFVWAAALNPTIYDSAISGVATISVEDVQDSDADYVISAMYPQIAGTT